MREPFPFSNEQQGGGRDVGKREEEKEGEGREREGGEGAGTDKGRYSRRH